MRLVFCRTAAPALALALLMGGARPAVADQCFSIRTNIVTWYALSDCASPVGVCASGTMSSPSLLGSTHFTALSIVPGISPDVLIYGGELVLTFSDGTITIRDRGQLNSATAWYFEVQQVIAGTGAYAHATGLLTSRGLSTPTGFQGLMTGTICTPLPPVVPRPEPRTYNVP